MDEYKELIAIFSENLEKSKDYHIAYIHYVGYVSVIGLFDNKNIASINIDEIFASPREMADSLLRNWRWQWFYENRKQLVRKDYYDIYELDNDVPKSLHENYWQSLQELHEKIYAILRDKF